jgi:ATP-dependent DNA helicase RecG
MMQNSRATYLKSDKLNQNKKKYKLQFPFTFTDDQANSINQILLLAKKPYPFSVLLQGDVGSGKTAVVLAVAIEYVNSGYQVALMAPTEILANQHFQKLSRYIDDFLLPIDILVGKEKLKVKKEKLLNLASGQTKFIVGTHALIQENVFFTNLGLIIIDEQHRFGVKQRESLRAKGKNPDLVALTATPIPRTLAMSLYGNLTTVFLREKPPGRGEIDTRWFDEKSLDGIYRSIIKYVKLGQQAFIVYPLVKESEKIDLSACDNDYNYLSSTVLKEYRCGLLHGQMDANTKNNIMQNFQNNNIQILFATTVIEVGIDIPNASIMVIRNAERFGLSTLHQLRGRIGRSALKGFCILVSSSRITENGKMRLQALLDSNDGFYLADIDLKIRGPGELLGLKQSGLPDFKIANFSTDTDICRNALEAVDSLPNLNNELLKSELNLRFSQYQSLYS